jgi:hypothetical protein
MTLRKHSHAVKQKISRAQTGKNNSMYGRRHTQQALAKISAASRGKNNPMFGKRHPLPVRQKIRQIMRKIWAARRALSNKKRPA